MRCSKRPFGDSTTVWPVLPSAEVTPVTCMLNRSDCTSISKRFDSAAWVLLAASWIASIVTGPSSCCAPEASLPPPAQPARSTAAESGAARRRKRRRNMDVTW